MTTKTPNSSHPDELTFREAVLQRLTRVETLIEVTVKRYALLLGVLGFILGTGANYAVSHWGKAAQAAQQSTGGKK